MGAPANTSEPAPDRAQATREALLAALERLVQDGDSVQEISIERLIKEAGVSRWRFYKYFSDKGDLLRSCFDEIRRELEAVGEAIWSMGAAPTAAELEIALQEIASAYLPHGTLLAAIQDTAPYDGATRRQLETMETARIARWRGHIELGQRNGWIKPNLDAAETAAWIEFTGTRGFQQMVGAGESTLDEFAAAFASFVWFVLYA